MMDWIYPQTPVFINEFHYGNAGTDMDEGVEVAGIRDTSLHAESGVICLLDTITPRLIGALSNPD